MPDRRTHRGPGPQDNTLFRDEATPHLATAVDHLSWLLTRGYAEKSALALVGDRFGLRTRQRIAVNRCACPDQARRRRMAHELSTPEVNGKSIAVDGYNVLMTIEAALGGAVILHARDTCYRDMASMHGSYRKVDETIPAIELLGGYLHDAGVISALIYLDRPVSNSGRLRTMMLDAARGQDWSWEVRLVNNPDRPLIESDAIVCTADSVVLDRAARWFNLARRIVETHTPDAWVIDLSTAPRGEGPSDGGRP